MVTIFSSNKKRSHSILFLWYLLIKSLISIKIPKGTKENERKKKRTKEEIESRENQEKIKRKREREKKPSLQH